MDGSNFEQHFFTLEEYLLHNQTPQIVIFEAETASLDPAILRFKKELFLPHRADSDHMMELFGTNWEERLGYWLFSSAIYKQGNLQLLNNVDGIFDRIKRDEVYTPVSDKVMKVDVYGIISL